MRQVCLIDRLGAAGGKVNPGLQIKCGSEGVVQLSGFVNSRADINRAVSIAREVKGVTSVENDMKLK
ncbi:BON domain-containing protein [Marinimicrobium sp. UBA4509]|nr:MULTISPECIES: BON domain-containing protein [unclassified Marinimicrobium]